MTEKNAFGLSENVASALCYLFAYVSGIVFLIAEKENKVIRFHALQSIIWFGALAVLSGAVYLLFGWVFLLGGLALRVVSVVQFVSWVYLVYSAFVGKMIKLPIIGDAVWAQIDR